jgi:hypothetical protein
MKGLSRDPSPTVNPVHRPEMSRGLANSPVPNAGNKNANVLKGQSQKRERPDRGSPVAGLALEHRPPFRLLCDGAREALRILDAPPSSCAPHLALPTRRRRFRRSLPLARAGQHFHFPRAWACSSHQRLHGVCTWIVTGTWILQHCTSGRMLPHATALCNHGSHDA